MSESINLDNVLMQQSNGPKATMPEARPVAELLVVLNEFNKYELYTGTGDGVQPIVADGSGTSNISFDVPQENASSFRGTFVYFDNDANTWYPAYAADNPSLNKCYTAQGIAVAIDSTSMQVTTSGKLIIPFQLKDYTGTPVIAGTYYYLCQDSSKAGMIQPEAPASGIKQVVCQIMSVDDAQTTLLLLNDIRQIKENSGSGLEICDISTALYVDETKGLRRYLNGQIVDINANTQAFLNRLLQIKTTNPDYFTTEDNWQAEATLNVDGCVYRFVLNYADDGETVVSVRLPKYPDYVEVCAENVAVKGNGMTLGLTEGTNNFGFGISTSDFPSIYSMQQAYIDVRSYGKETGIPESGTPNTKIYKSAGITTDPTKSGIVGTLTQTKLKMRYFIQIATGSETENNITNTLENVNGFTLLESRYSDKPLYNEGWLLSNNQWNLGGVYITVYEGLQVEYNTEIEAGTTVTLPSGTKYTKRGLSVKLSTEDYTNYDFVLNTVDETFRLPLDTIDHPINSTSTLLVKGNGMTLGLTNGSLNSGLTYTNGVYFSSGAYGKSVSTSDLGSAPNLSGTIGVTTDATKSGIVADLTSAKANLYLYFYVGNVSQNSGIINAGRIGEQLANKIDTSSLTECTVIIDTYVNGTSWYRVYSDGWIEQGGVSGNDVTITFLKPFSNTDYMLNISVRNGTSWGGSNYMGTTVTNLTKTSAHIALKGSDSTAPNLTWVACGYID